MTAAMLRLEAGRDPLNHDLTALIGEVDVTFDVFEPPGEPGLSICTYSVEEGSASAGRFALLANSITPQ